MHFREIDPKRSGDAQAQLEIDRLIVAVALCSASSAAPGGTWSSGGIRCTSGSNILGEPFPVFPGGTSKYRSESPEGV